MHRVNSYVYAYPEDSSLGLQQCYNGDLGNTQCTLENLRPDTEYTIVTKSCAGLAACSALKIGKRFWTAKPVTLDRPTDVKAANATATSITLTWPKPKGDTDDSTEYRVSLMTPGHPEIPEKTVACAATLAEDKYTCQVENLYTEVSYSATVSACITDGFCSEGSQPVNFKTVAKDGYVLQTPSIESLKVQVSWTSNHTEADAEFRILVDGSSTAACTVPVVAGEHTCQLKGLTPSQTYSVKLTACTISTNVCEDLYNLPVPTVNAATPADGSLIAVSVMFAIFCLLLIALTVILVPTVRKDKLMYSNEAHEKHEVYATEG
ncbi:unnamed protein product [Dibothriocephalus latus]|uniref:Fibronectin type-III domain-containing protein n=1 Tax=Dibothriocephalus latus TaxID=60516 RepID=A0A3P7LG70_DIBLA|nr:unnamed protein product [Dibothriocephalus latus]